MLTTLFENIKIGAVVVGLGIAMIFGYSPAEQSPIVKGTFQTPDVKALFETSLASKINSTVTSMTLTSATTKDGNSLASSTYGFIIDEGTSAEEFVMADCTATVCTNMIRGISTENGTSSVSTLKFEHRRGASVKITTAPSLLFVINALKGRQNLENTIRYDGANTPFLPGDIVDKQYVDDTAFSGAGVVNASVATRGVVVLGSSLNAASSTATFGGNPLVIQSQTATSTYNAATAALKVVVTQNNGKIDENFLPSSLSNRTLSGTTTINFASTTDSVNGGQDMWYLLASTSLSANAASMTASNIPPRKILKIYVEVAGTVAGTAPVMTFNGDTGSGHYTWKNATSTDGSTGSIGIPVNSHFNNNGSTTMEMAVFDGGQRVKRFSITGVVYATSTLGALIGQPSPLMFSALWGTTTEQYISSINIAESGGNIIQGSSIYVYGSAF